MRSVSVSASRLVRLLRPQPVPSPWERSPWLRHHRLVLLDEAGEAMVGQQRIGYDELLGLRQVTPE
jgi:hypothetical protein